MASLLEAFLRCLVFLDCLLMIKNGRLNASPTALKLDKLPQCVIPWRMFRITGQNFLSQPLDFCFQFGESNSSEETFCSIHAENKSGYMLNVESILLFQSILFKLHLDGMSIF